MSFSDNLKKARKEKGLSQEDLAELLITSPNENVIMKCIKVVSSQEFKTGKQSPKWILMS